MLLLTLACSNIIIIPITARIVESFCTASDAGSEKMLLMFENCSWAVEATFGGTPPAYCIFTLWAAIAGCY